MTKMAHVVLVALSLILSVCVQCYVSPPQMRMRNTFTIGKQTSLNSKVHEAAEAGDLETVMNMTAADPSLLGKYDIDGQLCLHFAAKNGHFDMVKYLVEQKPGLVNFKNIRWRTPLYWACAYAGYEGYESCRDIALYLVKNGADLKQSSKDNVTPLDVAKKGPLGKPFWEELKNAAVGVQVVPLCLAENRVYWG